MKKIFFAILMMTSFSALAADLPASLKDTMKQMSEALKIAATQVKKPELNESSAVQADNFVKFALHAKTFSPGWMASLPADQQVATKADYDHALDQTAELGVQMAQAFRANDNATASILLNQLLDAKKEGHKQFKK